jgi:hypothetical protein
VTVSTPQQLVITSQGQFERNVDFSTLVEIDFTLGPDHACSVVQTPSSPAPAACG